MIHSYKSARVIPFIHWDYELKFYPQPLHRELAHWAIENGAYAVIGCHSHCIQDVEVYKGHIIAYGLGNFMFPNNYYFNKKLAFPLFTEKEYGIDLGCNSRLVEFAHDKATNSIILNGQKTIKNSTLQELNLSPDHYKKSSRSTEERKNFCQYMMMEKYQIG